jgi:prepilin-type N-terminal cleavage/methylation domain-containing protein/prepilin-type processing-associated H-X9-DG protein
MLGCKEKQELQKRRFQGFTLIELLVVVAIIGVLAAILFPVFARARENARRAGCMSNMKQLGLAILQYSQDYDEKMVPGFETSNPAGYATDFNGNPNAFWYMILQPYIKNTQILHCPSATGDSRSVSYAAFLVGYGSPSTIFPTVSNLGFGGTVSVVSLAQAARPAESIVLLEDSKCDKQTTCATSNIVAKLFTGGGYFDVSAYNWNNGNYTPRHFDGMNFLFFDGHVKWQKPQTLRFRNVVLNDSPQSGWTNW